MAGIILLTTVEETVVIIDSAILPCPEGYASTGGVIRLLHPSSAIHTTVAKMPQYPFFQISRFIVSLLKENCF
jgi:hypothetical protein